MKYAGQQQWLFSMLFPLKMEKSRRKLFRASHIMLLWGAGAELFVINAMFANFWPTIIEDQCSSIPLCNCTGFNGFLSKNLKNIKWLK